MQPQKVIILGADGYLGWPTAIHFHNQGCEVWCVDSYDKRKWEAEVGVKPLNNVPLLQARVYEWNESLGEGSPPPLRFGYGTLLNTRFLYDLIELVQPDTIIHYAEQPSAPYSMSGREAAVETQLNNVVGTLNLIFAIKKFVPDCHLIKLGSMGEYGTPNIDIEEGWLTIKHKGREQTIPFPKDPGSFYHLSKVHDSANLMLAAKLWDLVVTDLNQGVVYGTGYFPLNGLFATSFHYDDIFGTVLNRFIVQAVIGQPLTVYGTGAQRRAFLNIRDTLACVWLAACNRPEPGKFCVRNQFTETFSIEELAYKVVNVLDGDITRVENPRIEAAEHHYQPSNKSFLDMGLSPLPLDGEAIDAIAREVRSHINAINPLLIQPRVRWKLP